MRKLKKNHLRKYIQIVWNKKVYDQYITHGLYSFDFRTNKKRNSSPNNHKNYY